VSQVEPSGPRREGVEIRSAQIQSVDFAERIVDLVVAPYGVETPKAEYRGQIVTEVIEPGAFLGIETRDDHVTANREHDYGRTFGKVVEYRHEASGLIARIRVSETPLGDETLQLAADGVLKGSAGMVVRRRDQTLRNGFRRVKRAFLDHVALVPNPAYRGTDVLAVRQGQQQVAEEVAPPTPNLDAILALLGE
jgi:HK97 family phage prohead protease